MGVMDTVKPGIFLLGFVLIAMGSGLLFSHGNKLMSVVLFSLVVVALIVLYSSHAMDFFLALIVLTGFIQAMVFFNATSLWKEIALLFLFASVLFIFPKKLYALYKKNTALFLFLIVWVGVSILLSLLMSRQFGPLVLGIRNRFLFFPLLFVPVFFIRSRISLNRYFTLFFLLAMANALFGLMQVLLGFEFMLALGYDWTRLAYFAGFIRAIGTFGWNTTYAFFLLTAGIIYLEYLRTVLEKKKIYDLFTVLIFVGMVLSFNKTIWLLTVIYFLYKVRKPIVTFIALAGVVLSGIVLYPLISGTISDRFNFWLVAFKQSAVAWLIGGGLGLFQTSLSSSDAAGVVIDNSYLLVLKESGLVGLALFFLFLLHLYKQAFARFKALKEFRGLGRSLFITMVFFLLFGLTHVANDIPTLLGLVVPLMGILLFVLPALESKNIQKRTAQKMGALKSH